MITIFPEEDSEKMTDAAHISDETAVEDPQELQRRYNDLEVRFRELNERYSALLRDHKNYMESMDRKYDSLLRDFEELKRSKSKAGRKPNDEKWTAKYKAFEKMKLEGCKREQIQQELNMSRATYFRYNKIYSEGGVSAGTETASVQNVEKAVKAAAVHTVERPIKPSAVQTTVDTLKPAAVQTAENPVKPAAAHTVESPEKPSAVQSVENPAKPAAVLTAENPVKPAAVQNTAAISGFINTAETDSSASAIGTDTEKTSETALPGKTAASNISTVSGTASAAPETPNSSVSPAASVKTENQKPAPADHAGLVLDPDTGEYVTPEGLRRRRKLAEIRARRAAEAALKQQ